MKCRLRSPPTTARQSTPTSLATTLGVAAPWFRMTAAEVIVGATLNAAYALQLQRDRGSLQVGKRGDLTILDIEHPNELTLAVGQGVLSDVVIGGEVVATPPAIVPSCSVQT